MFKYPSILQESKTIAIVGLSPNPTKDSYEVGKYLKEVGYEVIPIYPKEEFILGNKVYSSLKEALEASRPDIVVVFRKSEACKDIACEILQSKVYPKLFWMQLEIFNQEARDMLEPLGIEVVENKCIKIEHQKLGV